MADLTVHVSASYQRDDRALAVPFEVFTPEGSSLAQGIASPQSPNTVVLDVDKTANVQRVYVVARLPSRQRVEAMVPLHDGANSVTLDVGSSSPHEWLEWVTPFRSLEHLREERFPGKAEQQPRRIGRVWMTLWARGDGGWTATDLQPIEQLRDRGMRQIELSIPERPHLLQVGGDDVAWRLVSLPSGGDVRVAVTRSSSDEGDSVEITVGRVTPVNELLMAYLSSGATAEAAQFADAWQVADLALYEKVRDPVSAAAGAYVLLKLKRLEERRAWVRNLTEWFPYLSDGPIVAAALALQSRSAKVVDVRRLVTEAIGRGPPLFALGASVLVETMAAIHRGKFETRAFRAAYQGARAYLQAQTAKGAYFAFYGRSPTEPSSMRIFGSAQSPKDAGTSQDPTNRAQLDVLVRPRLPALPVARPVDERLLQLGFAREFHLTRAALPAYIPGPGSVSNELVDPTNSERQRNAFTVFEGDE